MSNPNDLTIGRIAAASGVHVETIRYYERIGLMPEPPRSAGRHRIYDNAHLERLVFIRRGRELGFSLEQIRALLGLASRGYSCGEVRALALGHAAEIREKIRDLRRMERMLSETAKRCRGGRAPDCAIVEALSG